MGLRAPFVLLLLHVVGLGAAHADASQDKDADAGSSRAGRDECKLEPSTSIQYYRRRKRVNEDCSSPTKFKAQKDAIEIYQKYIRDGVKLSDEDRHNKRFVWIGEFYATYGEFLESFRPRAEINNMVMTVYVELFNLENEQEYTRKSCSKFSFKPFFTEKLKKDDLTDARKLFLKIADEKPKLKHKELLLLPIVHGGHWVLVCINFLFNQINFFDSVSGADGLDTHEVAKRVIENFSTLWEETGGKCVKGFKKHRDSYPRQRNTYDCGLYTMIYMERWDGKILKSFEPDTVDEFRKLITYRLIKSTHNKADPSFVLGSDAPELLPDEDGQRSAEVVPQNDEHECSHEPSDEDGQRSADVGPENDERRHNRLQEGASHARQDQQPVPLPQLHQRQAQQAQEQVPSSRPKRVIRQPDLYTSSDYDRKKPVTHRKGQEKRKLPMG